MNPKKLIPVAQLSKDPSTKIGAIVFDDSTILFMGFNGFPRGVDDHPGWYADRPVKYKYMSHAESNAIAHAARNGTKLLNSNILVTELCPCSTCAKLIIQAGIKKVYVPKYTMSERWERWSEEFVISMTMFNEAKIEIEEYDLGEL
jgi:dCMP deaminase